MTSAVDSPGDPVWASAVELAAAIRDRRLSSREATEMLLARIDRLDPAFNLVVTVDAERARREATERDRSLAAAGPSGPLHGVPMTVKDSFSTAGMRTTSGAPELADFVPDRDADPVARLRAAGAVILGKTNLPTWAADVQTDNPVFGRSLNPWNPERTPGGSSGGSAGALCAGMTPLELGSDIGGSIRNPAHSCGVVGHKPSFGIVSARGQIPGLPGTLTQADLAVAGPMARHVEDLEVALDVLSGPDDWQAAAWRLDLPPARVEGLRGARVAAWLDDPFCPVSAETLRLLQAAVAVAEDAGARVDTEARPPFGLEEASGLFDRLLAAAMCGQYSHAEIERMAASAPGGGALGHRHASLRHRAWLTANEKRLQMRRRWREFFEDWDVLVLPVSPTPAIPHDPTEPLSSRRLVIDGVERPYQDQFPWMGMVGVAWLPATVIPAGVGREGLPIGLQIVGPYLEDRTPLVVARELSRRLGGCPRPPGL